METANESGNEKLTSRARAFVVFEKEFRRFEVQKECDSMRLFITRKLRDLTAEKKRNSQTSKDTNLNLPLILIYIWINEISKERTDCYIIRKLGFYRRNSLGSLLFRIGEALLYYRLVNHNSRESNTKLYLNIDKPRNTIGYVKLHANRSA